MYSYVVESDCKNLTFKNYLQKIKIRIRDQRINRENNQSLNLVVDIYSLNEAPNHPYNHYTWQKFSLEDKDLDVFKFIELSYIKGNFSIKFDNKNPEELWKNDQKINSNKQFLIQIILRERSLSNRIIFNLQIPAFKSDKLKKNFYLYKTVNKINSHHSKKLHNLNFYPQRKIILYQDKVFKNSAVGNFFLNTYKILNLNGFIVEAYSNNYDLNLNNFISNGHQISKEENKNNTLIYFYFDKDDLITNIHKLNFKNKVLYYQNITNPDLFKIFDPESMDRCNDAIKNLEISIDDFDYVISNSYFTQKQVQKIYLNKRKKVDFVVNSEKKLDKLFNDFSADVKASNILKEHAGYFLKNLDYEYHGLKKKILDDDFTLIPYNETGKNVDFSYFREKHKKINLNFEACPPFYLEDFHRNLIKNKKLKKINKSLKILSVCRKVPNKKIEDLIHFYLEFKKFNKNSILTIIGDSANKFYKEYIKFIIKKNKISSKEINFVDYFNDKQLMNEYQNSNVYLTMSEHEGFGIPILEAAIHGCLIYGYYHEAYESILPNCKTLYRIKNFPVLAENLNNIVLNHSLCNDLIYDQYKMLEKNLFLNENIIDLIAKNKI